METLSACTHCRTVMLPGQSECLRCGRPARPVPDGTPHAHVPDATVAFCPFCARHGEVTTASEPDGLWGESKPDHRVLRALVLIAGGLLLAAGVMFGVRALFFTPEKAINDHFAALADRDPSAALDTLDPRGRRQMSRLPLTRASVLRSPDYRPPTGMRIDRVEPYDDVFATNTANMVKATVHFRVGSLRRNAVLFLVRDRKSSWLFFHRWRLLNASGSVAADVAGSSRVVVAGQPITQDNGGGGIQSPAFAGGYTVRLPDNPLLASAPGSALVSYGYESPAVARLRPALRPSAQGTAEAAVRGYLDGCARSTDAVPQGCPLSTGHYGASNVSWTIEAYPKITLAMVDGTPTVSTETLGSVTVSGEDGGVYGGHARFSERADVSVMGSLRLVDGKVMFSPGGE